MGWTYFASRGRDTITLLKETFVAENAHAKWEWLDHAVRGTVVYAVMRLTPKDGSKDTTYVPDADGSFRFIAVFLTSRRGRDGYDFGYKDITESMGPVEKDCPKRLLDLASPFRDDYQGSGRAWRDACVNRRVDVRRAKAAKPKPGQTFRTLKPVKFRNGAELSLFECLEIKRGGRRRVLYRPPGSDALYRFNPTFFGFEICAPLANTGGEG